MGKIFKFKSDKISSDSIIHKNGNNLYNLGNLLTTEYGTLSITKTSGNSNCSGVYAKYGNVVSIYIDITTTGTTASGGDLFVGNISNLAPKISTSLVAYYGARPIIASFVPTGNITIRNAGSSNISSGNTLSVRGTFVIE